MKSPVAGTRAHPSPVATKSVCWIDGWPALSQHCCWAISPVENCLLDVSGAQLAVWLDRGSDGGSLLTHHNDVQHPR